MSQLHFLIDECPSPSLVDQANRRGFPADHVGRPGMGGRGDHRIAQFMFVKGRADYTSVTNNRLDFLKIHGEQEIHAGLVVIVPSVGREKQLGLFDLILDHLAANPELDLMNTVLEIQIDGAISLRALLAG